MNDLFNSPKFIVVATIIGILIGVPVNLFITNFAIGRLIIAFGMIFTIGHTILQFAIMKEWVKLGWWGDLQRQVIPTLFVNSNMLYRYMTILTFVIVAVAFAYCGHIKLAIGTVLTIVIQSMTAEYFELVNKETTKQIEE